MLGAFLEGQHVGYLITHPTNQRLHQIAVHPEHRRQDIAQALCTPGPRNLGIPSPSSTWTSARSA
ncbi:MAG: GNAT family N-acetyltransferase [Flavobacteriales bacterium]